MTPRRYRIALLAAIGVALAGLTAFAWQSPGVRKQVTESVVRQPTPYTELYFTNHTNLPVIVSTSYTSTFDFTIGNHEGKSLSYPYTVTATSAQRTTKVAGGNVRVDDGRLVNTSVLFQAPAPATQYVITVQLSGRPETIHFATTS